MSILIWAVFVVFFGIVINLISSGKTVAGSAVLTIGVIFFGGVLYGCFNDSIINEEASTECSLVKFTGEKNVFLSIDRERGLYQFCYMENDEIIKRSLSLEPEEKDVGLSTLVITDDDAKPSMICRKIYTCREIPIFFFKLRGDKKLKLIEYEFTVPRESIVRR